jgi:hypothetical protein
MNPWPTDTIFLKLVALLLSLLLWGGVAAGRNGAVKVHIPVKIVNLAPGLTVRGTIPQQVDIDVVGPRILLFQMQRENLFVTLNFSGVTDGAVTFDHLDQGLDLNPGLEVIRTAPGRLQVWVEPTTRNAVPR